MHLNYYIYLIHLKKLNFVDMILMLLFLILNENIENGFDFGLYIIFIFSSILLIVIEEISFSSNSIQILISDYWLISTEDINDLILSSFFIIELFNL